MLRSVFSGSIRPATAQRTSLSRAFFTTSARTMAEGDTGAPRPGGQAAGDAFTKREQADELHYVKEREKEKLKALRAKLAEQKKHLEELDKHLEEYAKEQGGEHN
ncbi:MAG: hypothetical protein M1834_002351 [Cirrosporium novae-zelandiae]|nr:MAG: hypothetical protein M1834_002351 [Cirrosporium novae-zelandiae]